MAVGSIESGKTFDPNETSDAQKRADDPERLSSFFQDEAKVPEACDPKINCGTEANVETENELQDWLGGRDSLERVKKSAAFLMDFL